MRPCWCGHTEFAPFSEDYGRCLHCETLVSLNSLSDEQLAVKDDEVDFYGKQYWLAHQASDLGFPDIHARARNDLTERNLHWLRTLLKYRAPPSSVLELGCAHGSFVALMRRAGYDARGVEMSAWVVSFGQQIFDIPIAVGPIEQLAIAPASLDVIALMDVLEHLPDPVATMRHCLTLLKPDGILLIQTPEFQPEMQYDTLIETDSPFLDQLKFDEHLYLFTQRSVARLFEELGAKQLRFEPAIFSMYDMFFVVGRGELQTLTPTQVVEALSASPDGRIALALLDLRERELALVAKLEALEVDRTARGEQVRTLTDMVAGLEADRHDRGEQVKTLTNMVAGLEADRHDRGEQVKKLTALVATSDADRDARGAQVVELTAWLHASEADRAARASQIETLTELLQASEEDRTARGDQLASLTALAVAAQEDLNTLRQAVHALLNRPGFKGDSAASKWPEVEVLGQLSGHR